MTTRPRRHIKTVRALDKWLLPGDRLRKRAGLLSVVAVLIWPVQAALLVERLSALLDIRLLGASDLVTTGFAAQAVDLRQSTMAVLRVAFLSSTVLELFAAIGVAMVVVYVGFSLLGALEFGTWGGALSPQSGIFLLLLAPEFYQPLRDLSAA